MSYELVYEQAFAAGNSLFSQTDVYHYTSHGTESAVGPDPLYPDAYEAETVWVRGGRGPNGENTLDWFDSPTSGGDDYGSSGFWARIPSVAASGLTVTEGAIEVAYNPNLSSTSVLFVDPLLYLIKYNSPALAIGNSLFWLTMIKEAGIRKLQLQFFDADNGNIDVKTHVNAHPLNTWWIYRVEFLEPTYIGNAPNADGYIRVYENATTGVAGSGTLIYEYTDVAIQTSGQLGADRGLISGYNVGYAGLFGEVTNIRLFRAVADPTPTPTGNPPDTSVTTLPCPTQQVSGATGSTPDPDTTILAGWTPSCEGGGTVPSAADISDSELWDPQ